MKKLRSSRGESLTETLAAVLIIAFAALLLALASGVAARLSAQTNENDEMFYQEMTGAENGIDVESGLVTLRVGDASESIDVAVSGGNGALTSWRIAP